VAASRDIDALYEAPLAEFTGARNRLAARLAKAGHAAQASEVKRLRKPTLATWIVNQLARRDPEAVERLLKAVDRLKRAQFGTREALTEATEEQRTATRALLERAGKIAADAALKLPPAVTVRVSSTLLGAAVDPGARDSLRRGRLTGERDAPGFDAFTGRVPHLRLVPSPPPARLVRPGPSERPSRARRPEHPEASAPPPAPSRSSKDELRRAREEARAAREEARAAREEAQARQRRAARLARVAEQKRRAVAKTGDAIEKLRGRLKALEQRAEDERRAAEEAAQQARRTRGEANDAPVEGR
jgi:hypothetical protein